MSDWELSTTVTQPILLSIFSHLLHLALFFLLLLWFSTDTCGVQSGLDISMLFVFSSSFTANTLRLFFAWSSKNSFSQWFAFAHYPCATPLCVTWDFPFDKKQWKSWPIVEPVGNYTHIFYIWQRGAELSSVQFSSAQLTEDVPSLFHFSMYELSSDEHMTLILCDKRIPAIVVPENWKA